MLKSPRLELYRIAEHCNSISGRLLQNRIDAKAAQPRPMHAQHSCERRSRKATGSTSIIATAQLANQ